MQHTDCFQAKCVGFFPFSLVFCDCLIISTNEHQSYPGEKGSTGCATHQQAALQSQVQGIQKYVEQDTLSTSSTHTPVYCQVSAHIY